MFNKRMASEVPTSVLCALVTCELSKISRIFTISVYNKVQLMIIVPNKYKTNSSHTVCGENFSFKGHL